MRVTDPRLTINRGSGTVSWSKALMKDVRTYHRDEPMNRESRSRRNHPIGSTGEPDEVKASSPVWRGAAETGLRSNCADRPPYLLRLAPIAIVTSRLEATGCVLLKRIHVL